MKHISILHNPGAGTTDHAPEELRSRLEANGFTCSYYSTKETDDDEFVSDRADIIAVVGGDGTVRKLAGQILNRKVLDKKPLIALIPSGTANNIARTLSIDGTEDEIIRQWRTERIHRFDAAEISGVPETNFMIEGIGFGVFPKLIRTMNNRKNKPQNPENELQQAVNLLRDLILTYKPHTCEVIIDGVKHAGEYIMVEVLNAQSIGPNLILAPQADTQDGLLDIVLVPAAQREQLAAYVQHRSVTGKEEKYFGKVMRGEHVQVCWNGKYVHVDDQLIEQKKRNKVNITVRKGVLDFLY